MGPVGQRLAILLDAFSPWDGISLTHREFAAEVGAPVTAAAVKKWPRRKNFPPEAARLIVRRAQERGLAGVTLEWLLWGAGSGPHKGSPRAQEQPDEPRTLANQPAPSSVGSPGSHGRFAAAIAAALEADLSHNEFGQWSSVEVQRTVIWALKDLSRRLRTLGFDMGKAFELTDEWAGTVGLPVRFPERSSDEADRIP
ncbi:MAG TPA: hypothetical protein VJN39_06535 [Gemmatimonadales bacterium]|nr:hypothetical protein [Gemmatimonadales bacterium]